MLDRLPAEQLFLASGGPVGWDAKIADRAVLHPESAPRSKPDICAAAGLVRQALEALYAEDHAAADLHLKGISHNSPLADWKLFVRGLAAYYQHDWERMQSNWSRLEPERVAARIARPLSAIAGVCPLSASDSKLCSAIVTLESTIGPQSPSRDLDALQ